MYCDNIANNPVKCFVCLQTFSHPISDHIGAGCNEQLPLLFPPKFWAVGKFLVQKFSFKKAQFGTANLPFVVNLGT